MNEQKIYHRGYWQGRFDALFDLRTYLYGSMIRDLGTGELSDVVDPDNVRVFEGLGLRRGQSKYKEYR